MPVCISLRRTHADEQYGVRVLYPLAWGVSRSPGALELRVWVALTLSLAPFVGLQNLHHAREPMRRRASN